MNIGMAVVKHKEFRIGDKGIERWENDFDLIGLNAHGSLDRATLTFMVKGLTATEEEVKVHINDNFVGSIFPYNSQARKDWVSQLMVFKSSFLNNGTNEIKIDAVPWHGTKLGDQWDDFDLKNIVCQYPYSQS